MNIYDQIINVMENMVGKTVHTSEIKDLLMKTYGTNPSSIILSDYCYNRYNNGIEFDKHAFEYIERGYYRYLGENYPYTGDVYHKPKGGKETKIGEWKEGKLIIH